MMAALEMATLPFNAGALPGLEPHRNAMGSVNITPNQIVHNAACYPPRDTCEGTAYDRLSSLSVLLQNPDWTPEAAVNDLRDLSDGEVRQLANYIQLEDAVEDRPGIADYIQLRHSQSEQLRTSLTAKLGNVKGGGEQLARIASSCTEARFFYKFAGELTHHASQSTKLEFIGALAPKITASLDCLGHQLCLDEDAVAVAHVLEGLKKDSPATYKQAITVLESKGEKGVAKEEALSALRGLERFHMLRSSNPTL
jgi:hypothetical protein